jgi:hypothetical protein
MQTTTDARLANHTDDAASSFEFVHAPQPANQPVGEHFWQKRFGGHTAIQQELHGYSGTDMCATVFRSAFEDTARLEVLYTVRCQRVSESTIVLSAKELVALAYALLDAAHDLNEHPALTYTAEEVPA